MRNVKTIVCICILSSTLAASERSSQHRRPVAASLLAKTTIVDMLSLTAECPLLRPRLQASIQPLLVLIARSRDEWRDDVLIELSSYRLEESNREIYLCAASDRAAASASFVKNLAKGGGDCTLKLANIPSLCLSSEERLELLSEVKRLAKKAPCDAEP